MTATNSNIITVASVDMLRGPFGKSGFRSGYWTATTSDGRKFKFYGSLPHRDGLNHDRMIESAQRCLDSGRIDWAN